jgi:hypothetical protein
MSHEQKMMSMWGNNPSFSRATSFTAIPSSSTGIHGGSVQTLSRLFSTPFWSEGTHFIGSCFCGLKFQQKPEDKIAPFSGDTAALNLSLSFHLEKMTPQESIDFLVNRVGHERDNATAEVRRSFDGSYGPLYQIAYLIGGLQQYYLHRELVDSHKMTNRQYNDALLHENRIPIEMIRAVLTNQKLTRVTRRAV